MVRNLPCHGWILCLGSHMVEIEVSSGLSFHLKTKCDLLPNGTRTVGIHTQNKLQSIPSAIGNYLI